MASLKFFWGKIMKNVIRLSLYTMLMCGFLLSCCQCIKFTDTDEFYPQDYEDFVYAAYVDFWNSLSAEEQHGIEPESWDIFLDMQHNYAINNIDIELEFVYRMLTVDELWEKYSLNRKMYGADNPTKSYKDQLVDIIRCNWLVNGSFK